MPSSLAFAPALALGALALEALIGYPSALFARIGHPVTWIGALIAALEQRLNRPEETFARRRLMGFALVGQLLFVCGAISLLVALVFVGPLGLVLQAILAASLPAQRSLHTHVMAVARALETEGLDAGRRAVSMIVGRDVSALDEAGVSRAAIESLAENFSDGVVAPGLYTALLGLPGGVLLKAINTADSMIGHRNERFEAFGFAAAKLDDEVMWPAARLSTLLIAGASLTLKTANPREALRAAWRDAPGHRSPNAGWPEAAFAGALGLKLAGPRVYDGREVFDAYMGEGRRELGPADIRAALQLYRRACVAQAALYALVLIVLW